MGTELNNKIEVFEVILEKPETLYLICAIEDKNHAEYLNLMFETFYSDFYELTSGGIVGGANWRKDTIENINNATACVVLLSPAYSKSATALWETTFAIELDKPILVVAIEETDIPPLLAQLTVFDATLDPDEDWTKEVLEHIPSVGSRTRLESQKDFKEVKIAVKNQFEEIHLPERVFIAYSRKQLSLAKEIYNMLIDNGKAVFYDQKLRAGAVWRQTIQKALDDATHLIVIWTTDAAQSDEVEREVNYALAKRKVIVPILGREIPELPYHLHGLHYITLGDNLKEIEIPLLKAIEQFSVNEDIWQ